MEVAAASVAANALRVGLNIAVGRRRPVIEFYWELHHQIGPTTKIPARERAGMTFPEQEIRGPQDIAVSIYAVNIGSERAEDVRFMAHGERPDLKIPWGDVFNNPISQMAPGQSAYLMRLSGPLITFGTKHEDIVMSVAYRAPKTILNWLSRSFGRIRGRNQYQTQFRFNASNVATDLPPPKYA